MSLVELIVALAVLSVGLAATASLTATAARSLRTTRALDEAGQLLEAFADSVKASAGSGAGSRTLPIGTLSWSVPEGGTAGWARFDHVALTRPVELRFAVAPAP